jgi:CRP-like cAMP-binding protein
MADAEHGALAKKLKKYIELSPIELQLLGKLQSKCVTLRRGEDLAEEGEDGHKALILQSGWACSYKLMPNGARQIVRFPLPGDFMGYRSILLRASDHFLCAVTDGVASVVDPRLLLDIFRSSPRLGSALLWSVSRDEAMVVDHLASIGRRSAQERMAHFFLQLLERLKLIGFATDIGFNFPLNQYFLADALGLSAIHVNRVLRQLREDNLLTIKGGDVIFHDLTQLRSLAAYRSVDPSIGGGS